MSFAGKKVNSVKNENANVKNEALADKHEDIVTELTDDEIGKVSGGAFAKVGEIERVP